MDVGQAFRVHSGDHREYWRVIALVGKVAIAERIGKPARRSFPVSFVRANRRSEAYITGVLKRTENHPVRTGPTERQAINICVGDSFRDEHGGPWRVIDIQHDGAILARSQTRRMRSFDRETVSRLIHQSMFPVMVEPEPDVN